MFGGVNGRRWIVTSRFKCPGCTYSVEVEVEIGLRVREGQEPVDMRWASMTFGEAQFHLVRAHLKAAGGHREQAARSLGVSERTLYRWMAKAGI